MKVDVEVDDQRATTLQHAGLHGRSVIGHRHPQQPDAAVGGRQRLAYDGRVVRAAVLGQQQLIVHPSGLQAADQLSHLCRQALSLVVDGYDYGIHRVYVATPEAAPGRTVGLLILLSSSVSLLTAVCLKAKYLLPKKFQTTDTMAAANALPSCTKRDPESIHRPSSPNTKTLTASGGRLTKKKMPNSRLPLPTRRH